MTTVPPGLYDPSKKIVYKNSPSMIYKKPRKRKKIKRVKLT